MHKFGRVSYYRAYLAGKRLYLWVKKNHPEDYDWFMNNQDTFWDGYSRLLHQLQSIRPVNTKREAVKRFTNFSLMRTWWWHMKERKCDVPELIARMLYVLDNS